MDNALEHATSGLPIETSQEGSIGERAQIAENRPRTIAHVVHCDSRQLTLRAAIKAGSATMENHWSVGQLISVRVGDHRVIGQTESVSTDDPEWHASEKNFVTVKVELVGEITPTQNGPIFHTGISNFPQMGCPAHRVRFEDLAAIYENRAETTITIGHLTQDNKIEAKIDFEKLLTRHFAIVGSTGVGKSSSVCMMIRKVVAKDSNVRVVMLDPHNEFASAFPDQSITINSSNLVLPFWLFAFEEIAEVIFRGQPGIEAEKEILRDVIVNAKTKYHSDDGANQKRLTRKTSDKPRLNADTPVPYRIADLLKAIDDRLGLLDNKAEKPLLKSLRDRVETITNDARFQFMFDPVTCGGDKMADVVSTIFRIPINDRPISVVEMSGLPSEVVSSVVSVLCRMSFEISRASQGKVETLVVCEEAHRYIPADANTAFWPAQQAIGRIAKEGRKYGVYLGIISQRPAELDQTILSQCNTYFAMRLSNKRDQAIIAGAFTGGVQSTIEFLPSIANQECIVFGEAVYSPMRMTFETVAAKDLPGANLRESREATRSGISVNIGTVIRQIRHDTLGSAVASELGELSMGSNKAGPIPQREAVPRASDANANLVYEKTPTFDEARSQPRFNDLTASPAKSGGKPKAGWDFDSGGIRERYERMLRKG